MEKANSLLWLRLDMNYKKHDWTIIRSKSKILIETCFVATRLLHYFPDQTLAEIFQVGITLNQSSNNNTQK